MTRSAIRAIVTAVALAGALAPARAGCDDPPMFDGGEGACPVWRQNQACACSEYMQWDEIPGVFVYEVQRERIGSSEILTVGFRTKWSVVWGKRGPVALEAPRRWFFPKDQPFPVVGVRYRYRVRGCAGNSCSTWSDPVDYVAAPYACYAGFSEIACYTGDDLVQ